MTSAAVDHGEHDGGHHDGATDRHRLLHLSRTTWILAGLGAFAIHAGCVALAIGIDRTPEDDDLGAPAIEIGVELSSPRLEQTDLPVGPNTDASAPSPAVVAQKAVPDQTQLPNAIPNETDDPDRVVSTSAIVKPKEDDPKQPTMQATPSEQSAAAEATAVPNVLTATESPRSVSPSPGTGEGKVRQEVTWQKELAAHFNKYKRYPSEHAMQEAQVVVNFVLDRVGHVLSSRVVKSSGNDAFDAAAIAMLQRANPVPPPPPVVADQGLSFTLPVIFHSQDKK
jgi:TonB family protein